MNVFCIDNFFINDIYKIKEYNIFIPDIIFYNIIGKIEPFYYDKKAFNRIQEVNANIIVTINGNFYSSKAKESKSEDFSLYNYKKEAIKEALNFFIKYNNNININIAGTNKNVYNFYNLYNLKNINYITME